MEKKEFIEAARKKGVSEAEIVEEIADYDKSLKEGIVLPLDLSLECLTVERPITQPILTR